MAKGKKVTKDSVTRKKGYLYYVGGDGHTYETPMKHMTKVKKKK